MEVAAVGKTVVISPNIVLIGQAQENAQETQIIWDQIVLKVVISADISLFELLQYLFYCKRRLLSAVYWRTSSNKQSCWISDLLNQKKNFQVSKNKMRISRFG